MVTYPSENRSVKLEKVVEEIHAVEAKKKVEAKRKEGPSRTVWTTSKNKSNHHYRSLTLRSCVLAFYAFHSSDPTQSTTNFIGLTRSKLNDDANG